MKISIIGLGVVGFKTFKEIYKKYNNCLGVDTNNNLIEELQKKYKHISSKISKSDIYIIDVYTTKQIINVIKKIKSIKHNKKPLIIIESTINPKFISRIINLSDPNVFCNLVVCPHRLNPNDKEHQVFNLHRVIAGASKKCLNIGVNFYSQFMNKKMLIKTDINHAIFSKIVENAYRFVEISIAEELRLLCENNNHKLEFNELRKCTNSKWNIDIKEALNGIGGKCLPKDIDILNENLKSNSFFSTALKIDKKYKSQLKKK